MSSILDVGGSTDVRNIQGTNLASAENVNRPATANEIDTEFNTLLQRNDLTDTQKAQIRQILTNLKANGHTITKGALNSLIQGLTRGINDILNSTLNGEEKNTELSRYLSDVGQSTSSTSTIDASNVFRLTAISDNIRGKINKVRDIITGVHNGTKSINQAETEIRALHLSEGYTNSLIRSLREGNFTEATRLTDDYFRNYISRLRNTGVLTGGQANLLITELNLSIRSLAERGIIQTDFANTLTGTQTQNSGSLYGYLTSLASWVMNGVESAMEIFSDHANDQQETVQATLENLHQEMRQIERFMERRAEMSQEEKRTEASRQEFRQQIQRVSEHMREEIQTLETQLRNNLEEGSTELNQAISRLQTIRNALNALDRTTTSETEIASRLRTIRQEINALTVQNTAQEIAHTEETNSPLNQSLSNLINQYNQTTNINQRTQLVQKMQSLLRATEIINRFENNQELLNQMQNQPAFTSLRELISAERDLNIAINILSQLGQSAELQRVQGLRDQLRQEINNTIARIPGGTSRQVRERIRLLMTIMPNNIEQISAIQGQIGEMNQNEKRNTLVSISEKINSGQNLSADEIIRLMSLAETNPELINQIPGLSSRVNQLRQAVNDLSRIQSMINNGVINNIDQLNQLLNNHLNNPLVRNIALNLVNQFTSRQV